MGKEKETVANPFSAFKLLKGEFVPPEPKEDEVESDIETGDPALLKEDNNLEEVDKLKKGDEVLKEVIDKQKKVVKKAAEIEEDTEDEEDTTNPTKKKVEEVDETSGIKEFTKTLYEKGIVDFDDTDEDFEDSEEGIETIVDKTVKNRINKWAEALPEDYSKFLDFVQNGGEPKQFLEVYYGNHSWETFKIEDESAQRLAVKESLRLSGEAEEDIEDMVSEWEINGTLEKRAKSAVTKLQKHEQIQKANLLEIQKQKEAQKEQEAKNYWDSFKKDLYAKEDIKGFKLTPKVKDKLWTFMTAVDKRTGKTPYEQAIEKNKDSSYLFAYLAMNDFDSGKLEKQVETKMSNKFSSMLKNYNSSSKEKISSGKTDDNYDTDPFAAFKKK